MHMHHAELAIHIKRPSITIWKKTGKYAVAQVTISTLYTLHQGGSVAEWLACWTQAQKGRGSNRSRDVVGEQS